MRNFLLLVGAMMAVFTAGAVTGDVNGDAEVNIADVNAVIEIIMNNSHDMAADVNGDGEINIADVNTIIDIILSDEPVGEIIPKEIALDYSELAEPAETIPEDEEALDYGGTRLWRLCREHHLEHDHVHQL